MFSVTYKLNFWRPRVPVEALLKWLLNVIQSVPRSKHTVLILETGQLMFYREIIAFCSEIHINTPCGQNVELLMLKWWYI